MFTKGISELRGGNYLFLKLERTLENSKQTFNFLGSNQIDLRVFKGAALKQQVESRALV